jgi:RHS repeat-associated protein
LGEQIGGQARYFTTDHLGSVREVTDTTGTLLGRHAFDPWGRRTVTAGTNVTSVGFTGHRTHTNSGLALAQYRGYDAEFGHWLSEDPLWWWTSGSARSTYVDNAPVSSTDPLGLTKITVDMQKGTMTVDPERPGVAPYAVRVTSGVGECMNEPKCSDRPWKGPVPPGDYTVDARQVSDPTLVWDVMRNALGDWGDWRVRLHPQGPMANSTRSGFFLHPGLCRLHRHRRRCEG